MADIKESNGKARLVGINHVALEVGSIEEALAFYGRLFELSLRGRSARMAFIASATSSSICRKTAISIAMKIAILAS